MVDEAPLTGESEPQEKRDDDDIWCMSGTQVGLVMFAAFNLPVPTTIAAVVGK